MVANSHIFAVFTIHLSAEESNALKQTMKKIMLCITLYRVIATNFVRFL